MWPDCDNSLATLTTITTYRGVEIMAKSSLKQFLSINHQIELQENLRESLSKAIALMNIALDENFLNYPKLVTELYFWVIFDLLELVRVENQSTLNILKKLKREL